MMNTTQQKINEYYKKNISAQINWLESEVEFGKNKFNMFEVLPVLEIIKKEMNQEVANKELMKAEQINNVILEMLIDKLTKHELEELSVLIQKGLSDKDLYNVILSTYIRDEYRVLLCDYQPGFLSSAIHDWNYMKLNGTINTNSLVDQSFLRAMRINNALMSSMDYYIYRKLELLTIFNKTMGYDDCIVKTLEGELLSNGYVTNADEIVYQLDKALPKINDLYQRKPIKK